MDLENEDIEDIEEFEFDDIDMNDIEKSLLKKYEERDEIDDMGKKMEPLEMIEYDSIIRSKELPPCKIVNVVCTYRFSIQLNLKKIALYYRGLLPAKFNPSKFAAMILTMKTNNMPPTTALIFSSSNVVHTGAKTEAHARLSAWELVTYFRKKLKIPVSLRDFKIRNIVSHFNLGYRVDLKKLAKKIAGRASFEPEFIHSCRIRMLGDHKRVALVYLTGAVVLTGVKNREQLYEMYHIIGKICKNCASKGKITKHEYRYTNNRRDNIGSDGINKINKKLQDIEYEKKDDGMKIYSDNTSKIPDKYKREMVAEDIIENNKGDVPYKKLLNPCIMSTFNQQFPFSPKQFL